MLSKWEIEFKLSNGNSFIEATPKTDMPDYIGKSVKELTKKIANLETEQLLINLSDESFAVLKAQLRSEEKRRCSMRSTVHDYDYVANKRAF